MNKLSELFKSNLEKWKNVSRGKKIAFSVLFIGIVTALIYLAVVTGSTKYAVLFSNLETNDVKTVTAKLDEKKVTWKANGNSISVPKDQVEKLRLELAPEMSSGSKGYELLSQTKFGATEEETKMLNQIALEGELERTIKGFSQIEGAKVHIVPSQDSVFVKDSSPASASVTLKLKSGQKLAPDQVKSIAALLAGSVRNLPQENVEIVDQNMTLLSKDLFKNDSSDLTSATEKQLDIKKSREKELEDKILKVLAPVYKDVKVSVNADLNFDAVESSTVTVDQNGAIVSQHKVNDSSSDGSNGASQSPVDNNMGNTTPTTSGTGTSTHNEETTNYEVGKTQSNVKKAPGEITKLTTSVLLNGNLDEASKAKIKNLVINAIGYDEKRGDNISIEGLAFDTTTADKAKKDLADMESIAKKAERNKMYKNIAIYGAGGLIAIILLIILLRKGKSKDMETELEHKGIDVLLDEQAMPKEPIQFKPIDFEANSEKSHMENEIKRYASDKPDQVADIIKSWLAEDER